MGFKWSTVTSFGLPLLSRVKCFPSGGSTERDHHMGASHADTLMALSHIPSHWGGLHEVVMVSFVKIKCNQSYQSQCIHFFEYFMM